MFIFPSPLCTLTELMCTFCCCCFISLEPVLFCFSHLDFDRSPHLRKGARCLCCRGPAGGGVLSLIPLRQFTPTRHRKGSGSRALLRFSPIDSRALSLLGAFVQAGGVLRRCCRWRGWGLTPLCHAPGGLPCGVRVPGHLLQPLLPPGLWCSTPILLGTLPPVSLLWPLSPFQTSWAWVRPQRGVTSGTEDLFRLEKPNPTHCFSDTQILGFGWSPHPVPGPRAVTAFLLPENTGDDYLIIIHIWTLFSNCKALLLRVFQFLLTLTLRLTVIPLLQTWTRWAGVTHSFMCVSSTKKYSLGA